MDGDELARLARRQHGVVTLGQARAAGLSSHQVRHRVRSGQWTALRRGVFLASSTPRSWPQAVLAACLAVPGPCWASHRTAAALWDLPVERGNAIHVTTPAGARVRLEGVRHHRSERLDASDVGLRHGIPVTSCARTLVDCLPWLPEGRLGRVVDAARRSGALAIEDLAAAVARLDDGGGRRPIVPLRRIVADRCTGAPAESDGERWVAGVLVAAGLPPQWPSTRSSSRAAAGGSTSPTRTTAWPSSTTA